MMMTDSHYSRRLFLQGAASLALAERLRTIAPTAQAFAKQKRPMEARLAFVASCSMRGDKIQAFSIAKDRWTHVDSVASRAPSSVVLHPGKHCFYVANEVDSFRDLPRGTIEAYGFDPASGKLTLLDRKELSLSGINPRQLAISPGGDSLAVAIHGGGAYNVFPIRADGALGDVGGIFKEIGSGPRSEAQTAAHPHTLWFAGDGDALLASDSGSDRISVFHLSRAGLVRHSRVDTRPGLGPGSLIVHPGSRFVYVVNELDDSLSCYRFDPTGQRLGEELSWIRLESGVGRGVKRYSMTMDEEGRFLYVSAGDAISQWRLDSASGTVSILQRWRGDVGSAAALTMTGDGQGLLLLDDARDRVVQLEVKRSTGAIVRAKEMARVVSPKAVAIYAC
ncbi:lactonase family protein [Acidipila rosea]|nr:beta-propeller fold lactonase family protein [Acidipila rosea]